MPPTPELQNFVLLLLGGICLLFLAVIGVRFFAALKTSRWTAARATILTSEPRARRQGESGSETVPHIVYEYTAASGETFRSEQLKPKSVPLGSAEVPHFLSRYPKGASVPVYYNPANPSEAVLEREPLSLSAERLGCLSVFAVCVVLALVYGLTPLHRLLERWFPHAENEDVMVLTSGMGVFLILFGLMFLRQGLRQRRWPTVNGKVVASGVESFRTFAPGHTRGSTTITMYRAGIAYEYLVGGGRYRSSQIKRESVSGSEEMAKGTSAKYPVGATVRVYYNPENPPDAVLETSATMGFLVLWVFALVMFAVAASVSGYFGRH